MMNVHAGPEREVIAKLEPGVDPAHPHSIHADLNGLTFEAISPDQAVLPFPFFVVRGGGDPLALRMPRNRVIEIIPPKVSGLLTSPARMTMAKASISSISSAVGLSITTISLLATSSFSMATTIVRAVGTAQVCSASSVR